MPTDRGGRRIHVARPVAAVAVAAVLTLMATVTGAVADAEVRTAPSSRLSHLATALAGAPTELPDPQVSPDRARQEADDILRKPEYQEPPRTWVDDVKQWIADQLAKLFGNVSGGAGGPVLWIVLAALVLFVGFLLFRIRGNLGLRRRTEEDPLFVTELEAARSPVEWLREAERLEAAGEWKQGLRCRYRALIAQLIDAGIVRDIPGRTSGEFRVETRRRAPQVAPPFAAASELFDEAWYGDRPTGPEQSQRFQQLASEVGARSRQHGRGDADDRDQPIRVEVGGS